MRLSLLISLSLALFAGRNALAQLAPADDFFNSGAQFYISNNIPSALERVESGLKFYPDDDKLKKLEELLKQKQQQQNQEQQDQKNQQNQSQQQKSPDQKNQQQQNQSSSQQQSEDQPKQDQPKQSQADQKKEDEKKPENRQSAADKQKAEQEKKPEGEGQPVKPGEMTPEEAKRLLDAQKGNEQLLQMKPTGKPQENQKPVKDW